MHVGRSYTFLHFVVPSSSFTFIFGVVNGEIWDLLPILKILCLLFVTTPRPLCPWECVTTTWILSYVGDLLPNRQGVFRFVF